MPVCEQSNLSSALRSRLLSNPILRTGASSCTTRSTLRLALFFRIVRLYSSETGVALSVRSRRYWSAFGAWSTRRVLDVWSAGKLWNVRSIHRDKTLTITMRRALKDSDALSDPCKCLKLCKGSISIANTILDAKFELKSTPGRRSKKLRSVGINWCRKTLVSLNTSLQLSLRRSNVCKNV